MIAYFKKMLDYDGFASHKIMDSIITSGTAGKPVEIMAHTLAAQQIWLSRCTYSPAPAGALWPESTADQIPAMIDKIHAEWIAYLDGVKNINQIITYKNLAGVDFSTDLQDILTHVINHGTHHRGQVGALLKAQCIEIPGLDYILYVRTLDHQL